MCKEEREDTKRRLVIRSANWQYSGQNKKEKREKNDVQNTTQKAKQLATQTPLKTGGDALPSHGIHTYYFRVVK
jgi:mannose-6-phosphate isomerase-like protein (cupin superfamily)